MKVLFRVSWKCGLEDAIRGSDVKGFQNIEGVLRSVRLILGKFSDHLIRGSGLIKTKTLPMTGDSDKLLI